MQFTLGSLNPHEVTVSIETWQDPVMYGGFVMLDLLGGQDAASRTMYPSEVRELIAALTEAVNLVDPQP